MLESDHEKDEIDLIESEPISDRTDDFAEIELPDDRTESEKQADEQLEKIDSFFASLQPGATLLIERFQPSWCAGILEEITITDQSLTLDYFIDTWGGQVLGVKLRGAKGRFRGGAYKIPLMTYPPRRYGIEISKREIMDYQRGIEKEPNTQNHGNVIVNPSATKMPSALDKLVTALPALMPIILKYIESSAERRNREMLMMIKMMNPNSSSNIADIGKIAGAMGELQKVFGVAGAASGTGEITDFLPQALNILESVLVRKDEQPKARLTQGSASPAAHPPNVRALHNPGNVAQSIASMPPQAAAKTIMDALGAMPAERRQASISEFLKEFKNDMEDEEDEDFETGLEK